MQLRPIGYVHNNVPEPRPHGWEKVTSELRLDETLGPGLDGIDGFTHLIVVFWLHLILEEKRSAGPQEDFPIAATFATRVLRWT